MLPYYQDDYCTIYNADCMDVLSAEILPEVAAIVTDPPYGTVDGRGKVSRKSGQFIEFNPGEWDKKLPLEWISPAADLLIDGGWACVFTDNARITDVWQTGEIIGLNAKHTFHWVKTNPPPQPRRNFTSGVETAVVFTKGAVKKWNGGGATPNYYTTPLVSAGRQHPTQKPIGLMSHLIQLFTDANDVVFDPFMGSGTTLDAAKQNGRRAIGVELNEKYCEAAARRISQEILPFKTPKQLGMAV